MKINWINCYILCHSGTVRSRAGHLYRLTQNVYLIHSTTFLILTKGSNYWVFTLCRDFAVLYLLSNSWAGDVPELRVSVSLLYRWGSWGRSWDCPICSRWHGQHIAQWGWELRLALSPPCEPLPHTMPGDGHTARKGNIGGCMMKAHTGHQTEIKATLGTRGGFPKDAILVKVW